MNEPTTVRGRKESLADRHALKMHILHLPDELESGEEDDRQRRTIILQEHPDWMVEQLAVADETSDVASNENQQRNHD